MTYEPGWKCKYCYTGNEHGWTTCDNCGADRDGQVPLNRRVQDIQEAARCLDQISTEDDIDLDRALGEIEFLVREARDDISALWKRNRDVKAPLPLLNAEELDQILSDLDTLKEANNE